MTATPAARSILADLIAQRKVIDAGIAGVRVLYGLTEESENAAEQAQVPLAKPVKKARRVVHTPAVKSTSKKVAAQPKAKVKKAAATESAPRITIRQRIIDCLKAGPKKSAQVDAILKSGADPIAVSVNIPQHLYLMHRDDIARRDDSTDLWSLLR